MKKILITGFDPFDHASTNPAFEAVKLLPKKIKQVQIIPLEVPTIFGKSIQKTMEAIEEHQPDVVINVGQAGGRFDITPERVAINVDDARIPDNEGNQPLSKPIYEDGEAAYFSTLPVKAMVTAIKKSGIPSSLSNTAGTFVCNHLMYGVLYSLSKSEKLAHVKAGFIHVPFMTEQVVGLANTPSLSLETISKGLEVAIEAVIENATDISSVAGQTH